MTGVFVRDSKVQHIERDRGEGHEKTGAEIRVTHIQAQECQGLAATSRHQEKYMEQILPQNL